MISKDPPLSELTVGDLLDLIGAANSNLSIRAHTAHGVQGIADLFGVSYSQAKRIKASGIIDKAISQRGRTIVVDTEKALALWSAGTHGRS